MVDLCAILGSNSISVTISKFDKKKKHYDIVFITQLKGELDMIRLKRKILNINRLMKLAVISVCCVCNDMHADVYGNVYYWNRGIATDSDGNGFLDKVVEVHDSLNQHENIAAKVCNPFDSFMSFTSEVVWMPYRGVRRTRPCIYFPQTTVVTNSVTGDGYGLGNAVEFSNELMKPLMTSDASDAKDFALAIRFRPDLNAPMSLSWLVNLGYASNTSGKFGFLLGFKDVITNIYTVSSKPITNYTAKVLVSFPGTAWNTGEYVSFGAWNDIVLSVKGQKLSMLISRTHPLEWTQEQNSQAARKMTVFTETEIDTAYNPTPYSGGSVRIGGETADSDTTKRQWNAYNNSENSKLCSFAMKRFRGSLQSFAVWTNALTEMEMREAAAWPRVDLWRVGVENGDSSEFVDNASGEVDVDADCWNMPKTISAGDSVTFSFHVNATGEADLNQLFSVKTPESNTQYDARVTLNGTQLSQSTVVKSGNVRRWFVPSRLLQAGKANKLTFTRCDSGSEPMSVDAFSMGGSFQYGERNNTWLEFGLEGKAQSEVFHLVGGNWLDGNRSFWSVDNMTSPIKQQIIKFNVPQDICKRNSFKLRAKLRQNASFVGRITINGTKICEFNPNTDYEVDVPNGVMQQENTLIWENITSNGTYTSPDYLQLIVQKPSFGTVVLYR